jgi:hypothetical protein
VAAADEHAGFVSCCGPAAPDELFLGLILRNSVGRVKCESPAYRTCYSVQLRTFDAFGACPNHSIGDETLPKCRKCTDSGRQCEGPGGLQIRFVESRPASPVTLGVPLSLNTIGHLRPRDEQWAFDYYVNRTAPILAGISDKAFWIVLLPRLAHAQNFVWDIVSHCSFQPNTLYPAPPRKANHYKSSQKYSLS